MAENLKTIPRVAWPVPNSVHHEGSLLRFVWAHATSADVVLNALAKLLWGVKLRASFEMSGEAREEAVDIFVTVSCHKAGHSHVMHPVGSHKACCQAKARVVLHLARCIIGLNVQAGLAKVAACADKPIEGVEDQVR